MARQKNVKKGGSGLNAFYWILGAVAVVGVGALLWSVVGGGSAATEPVEVEGLEDPAALVAAAESESVGPEDAPVKVIEFGDFMCPGCGTFATRIKPLILENYVDSGRVQFVFYDFPLPGHQHSFIAARAARCGGAQERYWDYHDLLFARQTEWSFESSPIDRFVEYAELLGLDADAFESCLRSDMFADVVTANAMLGQQLGVNSTPTVIVNGRRLGSFSYEAVSAAIDQALGVTTTP